MPGFFHGIKAKCRIISYDSKGREQEMEAVFDVS